MEELVSATMADDASTISWKALRKIIELSMEGPFISAMIVDETSTIFRVPPSDVKLSMEDSSCTVFPRQWLIVLAVREIIKLPMEDSLGSDDSWWQEHNSYSTLWRSWSCLDW